MNGNIKPNLIPGTPIGISIYSVTKERCHYHEGYLELIYCLKGKSTIHISYEDINLEEGDVISCDSYDIHSLSSEDDNLFVSFYFDLKSQVFNDPDLAYHFFVCERYVLKENQQEKLQSLKRYLLTILYFYCFPHPKASQTETIIYLATKVIKTMLNNFNFFNYVTSNEVNTLDARERFESILIYSNKHYAEKITLSKLAEIEHLSTNYLSIFYRNTVFLNYSSLLNFIRIYHSDILLLDTYKNISDIAYEVGFSDSKFFYRNFKKWYGHTPTKHRDYYKQNALSSKENTFYNAPDISETLEHYISFYFASLNIPEFWSVQRIPYRNVPME